MMAASVSLRNLLSTMETLPQRALDGRVNRTVEDARALKRPDKIFHSRPVNAQPQRSKKCRKQTEHFVSLKATASLKSGRILSAGLRNGK